jgi:cell division protein FtsW
MNFIKNKIKGYVDNEAPDYYLLLAASLLIIISIIFSYSLSIYTVDYFDYSQFHFFLRQLIVGSVSIGLMWTLAHIRAEVIFEDWKLGWILFGLFGLLMAIMPFLPSSLVTASGGANRWIRLPGFSLAPVEFFKIGFIFFLSASFTRKFGKLDKVSFKKELKLLLPYGVVFGIVVVLIAVLQKDLGQVVLLGTILFVMLIFANRSVKLFISLILLAFVGLVSLILLAPHRINRFASWWSSVQDTLLSPLPASIQESLKVQEFPEPYQVSHSLNAIYNGGLDGVGLSEGAIKLGFLSEVHTDFVLAGITEEIGLIGITFILLLMFLVLIRILRTSRRAIKHEYHLFSLGVALMISVAFFINAFGITGVIPIKGIAVPFLSYGGSSILSLSIAVGMVLSISKGVHKQNGIEKPIINNS